MRRISLIDKAALPSALLFIFASTALAADPAATTLPPSPAIEAAEPLDVPTPAPQVNLNLIDQKLALSLAVDTQAQIDMAEYALKTIVNDAVRRFVTVRLEGQRNFADQLDTLTDGRAREALAQARREIEEDRAPGKSREKKFRLLSLRSATAMLARIRLEILQEYAEMQRGDLAAKSVEEFDRYYLRCDILNQMQVLATLKVFEGEASEDFAAVIHQSWTTTKEHFDNARQLLLQLETAPLAGITPDKPVLATVPGTTPVP